MSSDGNARKYNYGLRNFSPETPADRLVIYPGLGRRNWHEFALSPYDEDNKDDDPDYEDEEDEEDEGESDYEEDESESDEDDFSSQLANAFELDNLPDELGELSFSERILRRPAPMELVELEDDTLNYPPDLPAGESFSRPSKQARLDAGLVAAQKAAGFVVEELNSVEAFYNNISLEIANRLIMLSNREAEAYRKIQAIYAELGTENTTLGINDLFSIHLDEVGAVWSMIRDARDRLAAIDATIREGLKYQKTLPLNNYNL